MIGDGLATAVLVTNLPGDEPWAWRGRVYASLLERHHRREGDGCPACGLFAPTHARRDGRAREEARPVVFRGGPEGLEIVLLGRTTRWAQELAECLPGAALAWRTPQGGPAQSPHACDLREWLRPCEGAVLVELQSPLRVKVGGRVSTGVPEARSLAGALSLRLRRLRSGFGDGRWEDEDIDRALSEAAETRVTASFIQRAEVRRFSTRQGRQVWLDGQVGWVRLERVRASLGRLLAAGEYVHAGKDTVMGCGKLAVRVVPVATSAEVAL